MAMVEQRQAGILGNVIFLKTLDLSKASRQGQPCETELAERDQMARTVSATTRADAGRQFAHAGVSRRFVVSECMREQDRVERAVVCPAFEAEGMRQRVYHSQSLMKADSAEQGSGHHLSARFEIPTVANGDFQPLEDMT